MAREYPRFLFSDPKDTKSKGPFIIQTTYPRMIMKLATHREAENEKFLHYVGHPHPDCIVYFIKSWEKDVLVDPYSFIPPSENALVYAKKLNDSLIDCWQWCKSQLRDKKIILNANLN